MRAVSLSNPKVIELLNSRYVPAYLSNEDLREQGPAPPTDKAEMRRIYKEALDAGMSAGSVHAYVVAPDGKVVDSMHTVGVSKPAELIPMLERNARKLGVRPGAALVKPAPPQPPACLPSATRLHLTARWLERKGDDFALVHDAGGNWSALPSVEWIDLTEAESKALLPVNRPAVGSEWTVSSPLAKKILVHFYPPTENWEITTNVIEAILLTGRVESISGGFATARLNGRLRMRHPFYHKPDDKVVNATIAGIVEFSLSGRRVRSLRLVTDEATYGGQAGVPFGVVVRSIH